MRLLFLLLSVVAVQIHAEKNDDERSFEVDYLNNRFLMNNKPFQYVSGEIHYFRIPHQYWEDRLKKIKAAGLNAIQTYVEWSQHEPSPEEYNFEGDLDLVKFIKIAQEQGLYVLLRVGPYICAERDFGGYPPWLLTVKPNMRLRTSDPAHTFFVSRWFKQLFPLVQPLLYANGGPVIMVQIENEYGSYSVNDPNYLIWLKDLVRSYVGNSAVLYTTDGFGTNYVSRGMIPGVFATVDFGTGQDNMTAAFSGLRSVQKNGPLVNSEFYPGWITYWGDDKFARVDTKAILKTMEAMLNVNASFSFYMFHGGTNFGFSAGSMSDPKGKYIADITSYDYDAPISEAGDLTDKYMAIREALSKRFEVGSLDGIPRFSQKGDYGTYIMEPVIELLKSPVDTRPMKVTAPVTFEQIGQKYGFVAYHTKVSTPPKDPSVLQVTVRDRALVLLDGVETSVLQYTVINETPLPATLKIGQTLTLLIENLGRRNFMLLSDCTKGLVSNATLDGNIIKDWTVVGYPLNPPDIAKISEMNVAKNVTLPAFFKTTFKLPEGEEPKDTFLDMTGWGKGVVFINEFNLGRHWHIGPQYSLYIPGVYLRPYPAENTLVILELHFTHVERQIRLLPEPVVTSASNK